MDAKEMELVTGQGSIPLFILPGLMCDSRLFEQQMDAFGADCIDGFYDGADRIETMAAYAIERMPPRCALLGHSMGARVALEVWRRAPERVDRLALANTGIHDVRGDEAGKRYALRDIGRHDGDAELVDAWLPPMIGSRGKRDPDLMSSLRKMSLSAGTEVFASQIEALLHRPSVSGLLATIHRPTFVIASREDSWSPVGQLATIAEAIPGAQLRIVEDAGHMSPAENPASFNAIIAEWLSWPADHHNQS